ncbi:MAG: DUF192 domain-containing protein [Candidatus Nanohaloarchaea archaeon]
MNIDIDGNEIDVEVADTVISRARGLALRRKGKMLFKFSRSTRAKIDMMLLSDPLYLYFMDAEKEIIKVQRAEPWSWDPRTWSLYSPERPYRYLLESFEDLGLEEGDSISFEN